MRNLPTRTLRRIVRALERRRTTRACNRVPPGARLHVACGPVHLAGWINLDKFPTVATDVVFDIRYGIPFRDLAFIFAEHFIEHLAVDEAIAFLRAARNALAADGVLRLSTPNLDWVYRTHYGIGSWRGQHDAARDCLMLNRAFYGWGHRFLYNLPMLTNVLMAAGFETITSVSYGESTHHELAGLERHERSDDLPDATHILIVEAAGRLATTSETALKLDEYLAAYYAR